MDMRTEPPISGSHWHGRLPPDYNIGVYNTIPPENLAMGAYKTQHQNPAYARNPQPQLQQQPQLQPQLQPQPQPQPQLQPQAQLPSKNPGYIWCTQCKQTVISDVKYKRGSYSWIVCAMMALFLLWPCFLFALCFKSCKDVEHSCPTCQRVLHLHKRI